MPSSWRRSNHYLFSRLRFDAAGCRARGSNARPPDHEARALPTEPPRPVSWLFDWLFIVLRPTENISLIRRRHQCRWRAAKFRPMLGTQGLWAGRDLYRATPAVTRGLGFSRSHPNDRPIQSPLTTRKGMLRTYSNPDPHITLYFKTFCKDMCNKSCLVLVGLSNCIKI